MNKLLWKRDYNDKEILAVKTGEDSLGIVLTDGNSITFSTYHSQDCCEHVYGDFSVFKYHESELNSKHIQDVEVKSVDGMGFLICFRLRAGSCKVFVPCYDFQNGYYSSNLTLQIDNDGATESIEIHECVEHHHD